VPSPHRFFKNSSSDNKKTIGEEDGQEGGAGNRTGKARGAARNVEFVREKGRRGRKNWMRKGGG
jgi:hypothetical protein